MRNSSKKAWTFQNALYGFLTAMFVLAIMVGNIAIIWTVIHFVRKYW